MSDKTYTFVVFPPGTEEGEVYNRIPAENAHAALILLTPYQNQPQEHKNHLYRARSLAQYLTVREGPGTHFPRTKTRQNKGYLVQFEDVEVYEERKQWARIDPMYEIWVSVHWLEKM